MHETILIRYHNFILASKNLPKSRHHGHGPQPNKKLTTHQQSQKKLWCPASQIAIKTKSGHLAGHCTCDKEMSHPSHLNCFSNINDLQIALKTSYKSISRTTVNTFCYDLLPTAENTKATHKSEEKARMRNMTSDIDTRTL